MASFGSPRFVVVFFVKTHYPQSRDHLLIPHHDDTFTSSVDWGECYYLYVVTKCAGEPQLQEPIANPARFS